MTAESELADSPSTMTPSSKVEHSSTRPPAFPNKSEITPSPFVKPPESAPSSSQANESLLSKPAFLMPTSHNPSRRDHHYEGRFPPAGPGRVPSLDGRFSFHRSNSSRSTSSAGGSSDWSSYHGLMEMAPDARQEWLRTNASSPSDHAWGFHREGMEKITASHSAPRSARSESCSICSRSLSHRSPWASSRVMGFHECNVVAVLVCGHTFHTECLEQTTPENARQDPACPRCTPQKVALKKPAAASVPSTSANPGTSANPRTVPSSSAKPGTMPSSSSKPGTMPSSSSKPGTVPASSSAAVEPGTVPISSDEPETVPATTSVKPETVPSISSVKPETVPSISSVKPETVPSSSAKPGTVRGSSFMSRPSSRNKLSRIGALDDSANVRKPRFSRSSSDEPSP